MKTLRSKLTENYIAPAVLNRSAAFYEGRIKKADERSNTCTVEYTNNQGVTTSQTNVAVKLSNIGIIDWFPKVNEKVQVTEKEGSIQITGPIYSGDYSAVRSQMKLKEDIFTDSSNYFIGGSIY